MSLFKNIFADFYHSLGRVKGNPKAIVLSQPFWSVPHSLFNPFMTQYMLALGLNTGQVGLISSIGLIFGMALSLFSGYITDRMGRRWSLLIFDLIAWGFACLLWGLSRNYTWFLAAGIANAFERMAGVPYGCMLVEGTPPENRLSVYSVLNLAAILANFCAPLMILFINPMGLVPAMRMVLIGTSLVYAGTFILRHLSLKDTEIAVRRRQESKNDTPLSALIGYGKIIRELFRSKMLLIYLFMRALYFVQNNLRNTYASVTVIQGLGFQVTAMSLISIITGAVGLASQFLVIPKLVGKDPYKPLFAALIAAAFSNLMLFLSPQNSLVCLVGAVAINAAGLVVIHMLLETLVANTMPDAHRSALMGLAAIFMVAVSAPFQYLGGILAGIPGIGPRLPQLLILTLTLSNVLLLFINNKIRKAAGQVGAV